MRRNIERRPYCLPVEKVLTTFTQLSPKNVVDGMPTALASQLALQASQNAQILLDRSRTRGKHASVESYLFANSRDASEHDLDSIFALGRSGFEALSILNPRFGIYEEQLFSYYARNVDRTLLTPEAARELDSALEGCLQEMGAYLMESAASKVLEWFVRRFRINEFNVRAVVALFLPYHETQHWGKMITILHLDKDLTFKFLIPHQKQAQKPTSPADLVLHRRALVQAMFRYGDVARLVVGLLGEAMKGQKDGSFSRGKFFKTLIAFWAATMHDFVLAHGSNGSKGMSEGTSALIFAAVMEPLSIIPKLKAKAHSKSGKSKKYESTERDIVLTSYILLAAISSKVPQSLTPAAMKVIFTTMLGAAAPGSGIGARQLVNTLVAVCATQDELPESEVVSDKDEETLDKMLAVPDVIPELVDALGSWEGAEKVIGPFLAVLVKRQVVLSSTDTGKASQAHVALETILSSALPPPTALLHRVASLLLRFTLQHFASPDPGLRSLLSTIYQRYPTVISRAREELEGDDDVDEADIERIDALILSLSLPHTNPSTSSSESASKLRDAILASSSMDASVRSTGVKTLLNLFQNADAESDSIAEALLARVVDTDIGVLEALYHEADERKCFADAILSKNDGTSQYLELVSGVLFPAAPSAGTSTSEAVKPPKRAILKIHLSFVINKLATTNHVNLTNDVFHRFVFPYLLYSKPRGKTADAVWDLLKEAGCTHPWIAGWEVVMASVGEGKDEVERMQALNAELTRKIAANIKSSSILDVAHSELIRKLVDTNPHVRVLGLLIIREVIKSSSVAVNVASKVLDALVRDKQLQQLYIQVDDGELEEVISVKLAVQVVNKPSSRSTESLLCVALLSDIAAIQQPSGTKETVDWAYPESNPDIYASLMQQLYVLGLSSAVLDVRKAAVECVSVLKELSIKKTGKAKKFDVVYAFDRIYGSKQNEAELQYLSPDDLAAYVSSLSEMREHFLADGEYIGAWHAEQLASTDSNQEKESIKYRTHILCFLLSHVNALSILPNAQAGLLRIVTPSFTLAQQQSGSKAKTSSRTRRKALPETEAALLLLPFLRTVVNAQDGLSESQTRHGKAKKGKKGRKGPLGVTDSARLAVKIMFGDPAIFALDDAASEGANPWDVFCGLLSKVFGGDAILASLQHALLECTIKIWGSEVIRKERRIEIAQLVIDAAFAADSKAQTGDETVLVKSLLGSLLGTPVDDQAQIIIAMLDKYGKSLAEVSESTDVSTEEPTGPFQRLAILAEVLASLSVTSNSISTADTKLPPSFDLISHLLETLSQVLRYQASGVSINGNASVEFVCQNIMSSIDGVAADVHDPPNLTPTPIRLDVLVEIIRVSANPQTLHQALLLVAELARLAPESVLRNVMPVFTFMGVGAAAMSGAGALKGGVEGGSGTSTMLSRDDGYGWGIVQKTVDSIVPVMVSSLKKSHPSGGLDLYIGAREFLRVFTDAANHIPRHRRTNFFSHLITVLGPKDFLAPVCLLLIEKSANKIARSQQQLLGTKSKGKGKEKDSGDAHNVLTLPTALIHHFEPAIQVWVLAEMLHESERLLQRAISSDSSDKTFLDDSSLEEHSVSPSTVFRRRAQAIITFVGFAAKTLPSNLSQKNPDAMDVVQSNAGNLGDVVSILITLSTKSTNTSAGAEAKVEDITKSARLSMSRVLSVMSAADFIDMVLLILANEDQLIQEGALSLLSTRLPLVAGTVRQGAATSIAKICSLVQRTLSQQPSPSLTTSSFNAVRAIGVTLCSGEESSVTSLVPVLVGAINTKMNPDIVSASVRALGTLPAKLGPRLIPHFRDIVAQAIVVLRDGPEGLRADIVQLLHNLLLAIPTFWSTTELTLIIKLHLDLCSSSSRPPVELSNLMKSVAKKAPAKVLLSTLCDLWRSLQIAPNMLGTLTSSNVLCAAAARPAIQENLRALFNVFLSAFEVVKGPVLSANTQTISAFIELVVKLNEPSFRPFFRRLYDWAFAGESNDFCSYDSFTQMRIRRSMFCRIYIGLLDYFKGLMNPYMTMLLPPLVDILNGSADDDNNKELLSPVLEILGKSLACDDGSFWRDEKIRQLSSTLISQIPVCAKLQLPSSSPGNNPDSAKSLLQDCLVSCADTVTDDSILKTINLDILMHTRAEDVKTKLFALMCAEAMWRACGSKLLGFVPETTTFIAECCEDENDMVTRESFRLKEAVESVAGSINGL
ncbi:hypothetical protein BT96DRAFT_987019 [Gymnopus androsaceus JB14]|uniref:U3 small nucleolar RNA-associated protein 10 n=1 Tax=Gymnopus androsaceus JB14 TaxID=1447944 RepID=A0A6A4I8N9_9AGAR|nr:hypothetical protein BT96DRAFT_987019 [Gymnopus androsaceus JB14]